jgi:hypothetical protein
VNSVTLASSTAGRIGVLIHLLGSDKSGEVIAAASAIKRRLRGAGLDTHALANVTIKALTVTPPRDDDGDDIPADDPCDSADDGAMLDFCLDRADALNDREFGFLDSLDRVRRLGHERLKLSPKQHVWLYGIYERLRGVV